MTKGTVAATPSSGGAIAGPRGLWNPRAPYTILAGVFAASALMVLAFYVFPGDFADARPVESRILLVLVLLTLFTWLVAPRLPGSWWLEACVMASGLASALATAEVPSGEGQLTIGFGLLALGIFMGYFRSPRHTLAVMGVVYVAYFAATKYNDLLDTPFLGVVLGIIIIGVSWAFAALVAQLRQQALHDGLTGLFNRHGLATLGGPVVSAARRSGIPVTVCVVDLDRFKTYNDRFGHVAGDRLLIRVADAWQGAARDSDLVVRFGGDEIVLVLVGATREAAIELEMRARAAYDAERSAVWEHAWTHGCTVLGQDESLEQAIARADDELLDRKHAR